MPGSRTSTSAYELLSIDTDAAVSTSLGAAAAVVLPAMSPCMAMFEPFNLPGSQELRFSSVVLSPNRVRPDFDVTTEDLYPLFDASPVADGYLSMISPATTQESTSLDSEGDAESFHSAGLSPATSASMSITHPLRRRRLLFR